MKVTQCTCKPFADGCAMMYFSRLKADVRHFLAVSLCLRLSEWGWERCRWRAEGPSGADIRRWQNFGLVPLGYYGWSSSLVPGAWCWSQPLMVGLLLLSPLPLNVTSGLFVSASPWHGVHMMNLGDSGHQEFPLGALLLQSPRVWLVKYLQWWCDGCPQVPLHWSRCLCCLASDQR